MKTLSFFNTTNQKSMRNESNVNSYAKMFPAVFESADGDFMTDIKGKKYLDFFCGAGALNYGHNDASFKNAILRFLDRNHVVHCLDMDTLMKDTFLEKFNEYILRPRNLNYHVQFSGPTGTNAVEASIKLARKVTGRRKVVAFTNSFHGMTATSLALSGCLEDYQKNLPSQDVLFFPYEGYLGENVDTFEYLEKMISTSGSGVDVPAAIILETIQAEGGVNIASQGWLKRLRKFTREHEIVLIVDDIQVGCGRTGTFFSFERCGIKPDIVLLSKSISGFGLPLSLVLIDPSIDVWKPGEHNGTFRGNNLSLCTATEALNYWKDDSFSERIGVRAELVEHSLQQLKNLTPHVADVRGVGMIWGIEMMDGTSAKQVVTSLFRKGMLAETCGNHDQVIKIMPPLTVSDENLRHGLDMIHQEVVALEKSVVPA